MNYTSLQLNSPKSSMLHQEHLEDGQKKERSDALDPTPVLEVEKEFTTSQISKKSLVSKTNNSQIPKQLSVMLESAPITKRKTSKGKSSSSKTNTQMLKSSKTLALDSIGTDQDLIPFWNKHTLEMSKKLWLPTKTGYVDSDLNSLSGSSKRLMLNSWFSAQTMTSKTCLENSQMTYLQSLQSLLPKITVLEQRALKNKEKILKEQNLKISNTKINSVHKVKLNLSADQKATLKKWFGLQRWVYNKCIDYIKIHKKWTTKTLRAAVINDANFSNDNQWVKQYPYDLRDEALRDLVKNINSNFAKGDVFQMKYKSRKHEFTKNTSLSILKKHWNKKNNFYSHIFKPSLLNATEPIPEKLDYDSRLVKTPLNKYYICLQHALPKVSDNQARDDKNMIFFDPGLKTFLTGYDPSGKLVTFGCKKTVQRIAVLAHFRRKLQGKLAKQSSKKNNKLRIASLRIGKKIENLVTDLHRKACKWICENYSNVYLPRLNFHKCKRLNKRSKSLLASFRHCEFLNTVMRSAKRYPFCHVYEVNEAYTSKTCSNCGFQKEDLKNSDTYNCDSCKVSIGRDINASKNVMLRYFTNRAVVRQPCGLAPEVNES